ncbi:hypothetical protein RHGRI_013310 [Rhododendron griersonianum]|uniref:Uncharacterized protein n=1 Tax=Rhododendron griersonianum TaxID=479676 RepID=A0AAV6K5I2_9ERIC|nr:hypothetical protein RHGRI_013310 [Rhododendron griersonianum]
MAENYNNSKKELVTSAKKQVEDLQGFLSNVISEKEKLSKEVESLQEKNRVWIELNTASDDKINMLNAEIGNANILFERLNTGSKTLDDILSIQRLGLIKEGLGYVEGVSSSKAGGKMVFVKANNRTLTPPVAEKARSPIKMNNVEYACIKSNFSKAKKPSAPVKNITAKRGEGEKSYKFNVLHQPEIGRGYLRTEDLGLGTSGGGGKRGHRWRWKRRRRWWWWWEQPSLSILLSL